MEGVVTLEQIIEYKAQVILPKDFILINKTEYETMKKMSFKGNCISAEDFRRKHTCLSRPKFNELILLNAKFRDELDILKNPDGCISYPKGVNSGKYYILESKLVNFIEKNFVEIFKQE
jgi:phage pi2 protein 07